MAQVTNTVDSLIRENMHGVFSEHDADKRRAKITEIWAEDGVLVVPEATFEGHSGVETAAAMLVKMFPTFTFTERGDVQSYNGVGRLSWVHAPAGTESTKTGTDVLVMKGDKIGALYVFPDLPKK